MSFGATLKNLRMKRGESLQRAADAVGISKAHFWELERGQSNNPSVNLLRAIADHYGVSISYLTGEDRTSEEDERAFAMFRQYKDLNERDQQLIDMIFEQRRHKDRDNEN